MSQAITRRLWLILLVVTCALLSGQWRAGALPDRGLARAQDEDALRAMVKQFYAAYEKKDLDAMMKLWIARAPIESREGYEKRFAAADYRFAPPAFAREKIEGERASLRATLTATITGAADRQTREEQWARNFEFAKEDGQWRVAREASAFDDLAEKLIAATTADEQDALMAAEPELKTAGIVQALRAKGVGFIEGKNRDLAKAISSLNLAGKIAEAINDDPGLARVLQNLGLAYRRQNNIPQAITHYQKSLALKEKLGKKDEIADVHNSLGDIFGSFGNHVQALFHFQKSLEINQELDRQDWRARNLFNIGTIYLHRDDEAQAVSHYKQCLEVGQNLRDQELAAACQMGLGSIQANQGNVTPGLKNLQESLAIFERLQTSQAGNVKHRIIETLHNLGTAYLWQGNLAQALKHHQQSLTLDQDQIVPVIRASNLHNIGVVHAMLGNFEQARENFDRALSAYQEIRDRRGIAQCLNSIGIIQLEQGKHGEALQSLERSLRTSEAMIDPATSAFVLNSIGNVYEARGDAARALEHQQKSLEINTRLDRKNGQAYALFSISQTQQRQGRHSEALAAADASAALARETDNPDTLWQARYVAGQAHRALNQVSQARQAYLDSIAAIETMRAQAAGGAQDWQRYFENKTAPYLALVEMAVAQNNLPEALVFAERTKARTLLDILRAGRADITKGLTPEERRRENELKERLNALSHDLNRAERRNQPIAGLQEQLEKTRRDYEEFQTSLNPGVKARRGEAPPLSLAEAGQLLPDTQHALLEFVVTEKQTFLFVLTRNPDPTKRSPELKVYQPSQPLKREELARLVEDFRLQMEKSDNRFRQPARKLYDLLLGPAQMQLKGKTTLVIVPDGPLWELPFKALTPSQNRYLLEDAAIFYAPSLTALREMAKARRGKAAASQTLLAIGNPALGSSAHAQLKVRDQLLGPLPQAEKGVRELQKLYGAGRAKIYLGAEASEETIKAEAGDYDILHFAAHAIFSNRNPMYSSIVLAQPGEGASEDGMLEAWEIMKLDLRAEQALLPACETARGRVGAGEGVIGLTWALFVAGAPTTAVSQWKVRADATAALMAEYHRQLQNAAAPSSKAQALRQASLKLLRNKLYGHPHFWAGIALVGDGF